MDIHISPESVKCVIFPFAKICIPVRHALRTSPHAHALCPCACVRRAVCVHACTYAVNLILLPFSCVRLHASRALLRCDLLCVSAQSQTNKKLFLFFYILFNSFVCGYEYVILPFPLRFPRLKFPSYTEPSVYDTFPIPSFTSSCSHAPVTTSPFAFVCIYRKKRRRN